GTAAANLILGIYLGRVARNFNSEALKASSVHVLSDVWSTGYVVIGLLVVAGTGWMWVDALVALGAAGHLSWAAWRVIRKSVAGLMDEMEPESIQEIAQAFTKTRRPGLIDLHRVKVIRSGNFHHIDGHVVIPEFWSIHQAHEAMNQFEKEVLQAYRYDGEVALHMDPCGRRFCSRCDLPDCQIRHRAQSVTSRFDYRHLIAGPKKDPE
ncbi:MAG: cation diffusion facilitator family transporter, partial [Bdellovibrio sp.]